MSNLNWQKELKFLLDGLFVPPLHAGNPPIKDWTHWHSKESYEDIKTKIESFIKFEISSLLFEFEEAIGEDKNPNFDQEESGGDMGIGYRAAKSEIHSKLEELKKKL